MVDGVLYIWVRNLKKDGTGSSLAWSKDHAQTWTWADWALPEMGYPVWLNAGKDYKAAQDEYVYMYFPDTPSAYKNGGWHSPGPSTQRSDHGNPGIVSVLCGLDERGQPKWSPEFADRKPILIDPGHCYRPDVVYNPGLKRYLLCTATSGSPQWCGTDIKYLGIFDSPTPWGLGV